MSSTRIKLSDSILKINSFLLFIAFIGSIGTASYLIFYKYAFNYAEPVIADRVYQIGSMPLYKHFDQEPFTVFAYNPIFAYLAWALSFIVGKVYACGRLVSFIGWLTTILLLYKILERLKLSKVTTITLALWACLSPILILYGTEFRGDLLALCFSTAGVYFALRWYDTAIDRTTRHTFLALLFFALAYFTRQSYVLGIGAFILFLLRRKFTKQAFFIAGGLFAAIAVISVCMNHSTHGAYFQNVFVFNANAFYWQLVGASWLRYMQPYWPIFVSALLILASRPLLKWDFWDFYLVLGIASTFLCGRIGSDRNYFIEAVFSASVYLLIRFFEKPQSRKRFVVFLVLFSSYSVWFTQTRVHALLTNPPSYGKIEKSLDEVTSIMSKINGPMLCENTDLLVSRGKPVYYSFFEYAQLARRGLWDEKIMLDKIDNLEFPVLVLSSNLEALEETQRFTRRMVWHIKKNYKVHGVLQGFIVMIPKNVNLK